MHGTESGGSDDEEPMELEVLPTDLADDQGALKVLAAATIKEVDGRGDEGVEGGLEEPLAMAENVVEASREEETGAVQPTREERHAGAVTEERPAVAAESVEEGGSLVPTTKETAAFGGTRKSMRIHLTRAATVEKAGGSGGAEENAEEEEEDEVEAEEVATKKRKVNEARVEDKNEVTGSVDEKQEDNGQGRRKGKVQRKHRRPKVSKAGPILTCLPPLMPAAP